MIDGGLHSLTVIAFDCSSAGVVGSRNGCPSLPADGKRADPRVAVALRTAELVDKAMKPLETYAERRQRFHVQFTIHDFSDVR
ncbi:hypothetical protein JS528_11275 [Bifidobacterium sp. MA2]|uniref:Uncharacterized protein n=1 Tax=Bifidobacterium santillanense TaxID=2809028 RepID=A0ABS5USA7_9BIFI|nr:hypothetical protein [Bifidobacterium santillanense]MBT1173898.1 hypothetical protein [Bifidobacterium santillanense]